MEIHCGRPHHPMTIRFLSGTIFRRKPEVKGQNVFYSREIKSWLGISWRGEWFLGFMRTGPQLREDVALTAQEIVDISGGDA